MLFCQIQIATKIVIHGTLLSKIEPALCGRYILVDKIEVIEKDFNVHFEGSFEPDYNISPGKKSLVITSNQPTQLQYLQFGMTPSWAKKPMYLFNARAEGDHNQENDPRYSGAKGILVKPSFRKPIRSQRCLVVASAFIEGTSQDGLSKPYLVYLRKRPFAFAGIWDTWINPLNEMLTQSFSIITTTANEVLQKIPHHRMPVILSEENYHTWLSENSELSHITELLRPYPAEMMNAYPISPDIKNPKNNYKELLNSLGDRLFPEYEIKITSDLEEKGFGSGKKKNDQ